MSVKSKLLGIRSPADFANALLGALGAPDTKVNVDNIVGWEAEEGGNWNNTAAFNPMNTTLQEPGSTVMPGGNTSGVQAYTSWDQGLKATLDTLEGGNYPGIIAALDQSAGWQSFASAVDSSPWGSNLSGVSAGTGATSASLYGEGAKDQVGPSGAGGKIPASSGSGTPSDNTPSKQLNPAALSGLAGVLQSLDSWYNPQSPGILTDITSFGTAPIETVAIMIFTRAVSSILFLGVTTVGVMTMLHGGSTSSGGGGLFKSSSGPGPVENVVQFVNQQGARNRQSARIKSNVAREAGVEARHVESLRQKAAVHNASREDEVYARQNPEYVPARGRKRTEKIEKKHSTSHIFHVSNKEKKNG
jgi:hypothetical protein